MDTGAYFLLPFNGLVAMLAYFTQKYFSSNIHILPTYKRPRLQTLVSLPEYLHWFRIGDFKPKMFHLT